MTCCKTPFCSLETAHTLDIITVMGHTQSTGSWIATLGTIVCGMYRAWSIGKHWSGRKDGDEQSVPDDERQENIELAGRKIVFDKEATGQKNE